MKKFTKLSATGNDFILFDNRNGELKGDEHDFFQQICLRRLSVGADGILLLNDSKEHAFSMVYYNSDGYIGEMCGNGARAAAWYAFQSGIAGRTMSFDVLGVTYNAEIWESFVRLEMPPPHEIRFNPGAAEEPFLAEGAYLNVGVPHYVLFAEDIDHLDVHNLGRKYRYHPEFHPWGTNTNFVEVTGAHQLKLRTYERGVEEETLACGTGTLSSAIVAFKQKGVTPPIEVIARGGNLVVEFDENLSSLYLTGEVRIIYDGTIRDT